MTTSPFLYRVFIDYDIRQPAAFATLVMSLLSNTSCPLAITPLLRDTLPAPAARGELEGRGEGDCEDYVLAKIRRLVSADRRCSGRGGLSRGPCGWH